MKDSSGTLTQAWQQYGKARFATHMSAQTVRKRLFWGAKKALPHHGKGSSAVRKFHITEKALRRCGRGSSAEWDIISGHAGKRYFIISERIMRYPEKYARKYGKPNIRKPEEFQAVPAACFLTFQDVFSSSEQLPDGASHTVTGWRYKMGPKPLCLL